MRVRSSLEREGEASIAQQKPWVWTTRGMELSYAATFIIGGAICFGVGWSSRAELFREISEDLGAITDESGLFLLGGAALIIIGFVIYLFGPSGIRIDTESREVCSWRGLWPRLRQRRFPFSSVEKVVVVKQWYVVKHRRRLVYRLKIAIPGRVVSLEYDRDLTVIENRANALAALVGAPIEEEERQPRGRRSR